MKIVHIELAGFYNEGMSYQTNELVRNNCEDGNDVEIISSNYQWFGFELKRVPTRYTTTPEGAILIRVSYFPSFRKFNLHKFRKVKGLYVLLEDSAPDVIFSHDLCYWSVLDVIRYKKDHPEVKLYADTHTAAYNSGTNWLSLHVLHRIFYRYLIQNTLPYLEKYFYVGEGERQFSIQNYGVPESLMEFYPLGGTVPSEKDYQTARAKRRAEFGIAEDTPLLVHSGKLDALKRTDMLLRAFASVPELNAKLAIIGSIPEDRKELLSSLMEADKRVVYLGWKSGEELGEYLCACDLYCQPGSESATLQNAVCRASPILSYPHEDYTKDLDYGNFIWTKTEEDLAVAFRRIHADPALLAFLREGSQRCARELLDYRKLAARLYQ